MFNDLIRRLQRLLRRDAAEKDLERELRDHLELETEEQREGGLGPGEAQNAARRALGNEALIKEDVRATWGFPKMETIFQDVRYGSRLLVRNPGFAVVAVITLALGIGVNTALFSVVNGVLLNPLPYSEPDQLVSVDASKHNFTHGSISYPNFLDWHSMNRSFSHFAVSRPTGFLLSGAGSPEELDAAAVTSDFFPMLGINPVLGRSFNVSEDQIGLGHVAAISTDLWKRKFGGSPDIIGREISLDGKGYTVVGIFPGHLDLHMGYFDSVDVYIPLGEFANPVLNLRSAGLGIHGIARLKPGITLAQAGEDMRLVTNSLAQTYPDADKDMGATLAPLKDSIVGRVRGFLMLLLGAVGFVLLIVCVNLANLMLARSSARGREMAVRSSLGAGTARLVRQLLTESLLLSLLGGALGLLLAAVGTKHLLGLLPATLPRAGEVGIDTRVLLFTLAVSVGAGILFGLLPALRAARRSAYETLKEGDRGLVAGSHRRAQDALVAVQMALALVLLAGAGLLIRSLTRLWNVDPGFEPDHILTFNLAMPPQLSHASPDAVRAALRNFDATISAVPGVEAESLSWGSFPMYSEDDDTFWVKGQPRPASQSEMPGMLVYRVGPDYLKAMRIPLIAGRFFTAADNEHSKPVVVVDDVLAQKYFHEGGAVGQSICQGDETFEIIGVVGHVMQWGLDNDSQNSLRAQAYFPFMQLSDRTMMAVPSNSAVVVRSRGDATSVIESIRQANDQISKEQVLTNFVTMHGIIEYSLAPRRFAMMLFGAFAVLALVLAGTGLYGVTSYAVGRRTHEIGVRMALGAGKSDVLRMVMAQGIRLAVLGLFMGILGALALTNFLTSLLFGIKPFDPLTFVVVSILLTAVALFASYIPARRATKVDPMIALRYE